MVLVMFVCFFENISQLKAFSEVKGVPKESFVLNVLLLSSVLMVQCLTNAWRVILGRTG